MDEFADDGINVKPTPITAGEKVTIEYDGLLSRSGANTVYLRTGFGHSDEWHNVRDIKMEQDGQGFKADLNVDTDDRLQFCFHDCAYNWDNNNGRNWSFEVHNGELY